MLPLKIYFPFFFGTSVLLIDDNKDYLDSLSFLLQKKIDNIEIGDDTYNLQNVKSSCRILFDCFGTLLTDFVSSKDCGHGESGVKIAYERLNVIFNVCRAFPSVVIVDYDMPRKTGIEFLTQIKDLPIKKILLTGAADEIIAVDAFNKGIINGYLKKNDENLFENLTIKVHEMRNRFYNNLLDPYLKWQPSFLRDIANDEMFCSFFQNTCRELSVHSYYSCIYPFGFVLIDDQEQRHVLLLRGQQQVKKTLENISQEEALTEKNFIDDCRNFPSEEVTFSHNLEAGKYTLGKYVPGFSNLAYILLKNIDVENVYQHYPLYTKTMAY